MHRLLHDRVQGIRSVSSWYIYIAPPIRRHVGPNLQYGGAATHTVARPPPRSAPALRVPALSPRGSLFQMFHLATNSHNSYQYLVNELIYGYIYEYTAEEAGAPPSCKEGMSQVQ